MILQILTTTVVSKTDLLKNSKIESDARPTGVQFKNDAWLYTVIGLKLSMQTVTSHLSCNQYVCIFLNRVSLLPVFGVRVLVTFHLMCFHIIFSWVSVAELQPFGK